MRIVSLASFSTAVELIGSSPATEQARHAMSAAADGSSPVLISAEAGLNPLAVAREIHDGGSRSAGAFISVDCAGQAASDLEDDIFGPALRAQQDGLEPVGQSSLIRSAFGGTLLLANLDGLPSQLQSRLARVLRDGQVDLDASGFGVALDVRIIATVSGNIEEDIRDGRIRRELFARFAVKIDLPPLRLRPADIPTLIACLAADSAAAFGVAVPTFTRDTLTLLSALPWRRNIEELREVLDVLVPAAAGGVVQLEDALGQVPVERTSTRPPGTASLRQARISFEREYIAGVLHRHRWRMDEAAGALGIQRTNLYRKVRQLGIGRARPKP